MSDIRMYAWTCFMSSAIQLGHLRKEFDKRFNCPRCKERSR